MLEITLTQPLVIYRNLHIERHQQSMQNTGDAWQGTVTTYVTQFSDFIFEQGNGAEEDALPVFQFQQDNALFIGIDLELSAQLSTWERGSLSARLLADYVDAELDVRGNDNVPRIPPLRYGLGFDFTSGVFSASLDYLRVAEQDDVAQQELVTDAYNDLRAQIAATFPFGTESTLSVFVSGRNLTDDEQRRHTSFIKDFAPAPGRAVEAGVRLLF